MYAAQMGFNLQLIKKLIELGAQPDIIDEKGETAKDKAVYQSIKDYLSSLI